MNTQKTVKWHISYLNKVARELRRDARKAARKQGFEPMFERGNSFSVGINPDGHPFVQVWYKLNGIDQYSNCAI